MTAPDLLDIVDEPDVLRPASFGITRGISHAGEPIFAVRLEGGDLVKPTIVTFPDPQVMFDFAVLMAYDAQRNGGADYHTGAPQEQEPQ